MNRPYRRPAHWQPVRLQRFRLSLCAAAMPLCGLAHAATASPASAAPTAGGSGLQLLFGMVLVLGLLMGIAWWVKRFGPVRSPSGAAAKIVGGVSVGARERVMVVEVGEQWIVIGVAPGSVNALTTLPRQDQLPLPDAAQPPSNFAGWLKQTIDKRNGKL